jgi:hypothetical protein
VIPLAAPERAVDRDDGIDRRPQALEDALQPADPLVDDARVDRPVAEDQPRRTGRHAPRREAAERDALGRGRLDDGRVVEAERCRDPGQDVETRRRPGRPEAGQMPIEGAEQRVAARPVDRPHPAKVVVELAAVDDVGQRQLVQRGRAHVGRLLRGGDRIDQVGRRHEPAEPQPRREDLARRARVHHALGAEALERPDRLAVVAELGVVVVLDDGPPAALGPVDEGGPPLGRKHRAGRVLVDRGDDHRPGVRGDEPVDPETVVVDGDRPPFEPGGRDRRPVFRIRRVLDRDRPDAPAAEGLGREREALGEARDDDHAVRIRGGSPDAVQVGREGRPQLGHPLAALVGEPIARRGGEDPAERPEPDGPRELADLRPARPEIEHDGRRRRESAGGLRRRSDGGRSGDARRATTAAHQVALGGQLLVRLDDDPARDAELRRERAGRRQHHARAEPAVPDRRTQRPLQPTVEWVRRAAVEIQKQLQVRTGPGSCHRTGP